MFALLPVLLFLCSFGFWSIYYGVFARQDRHKYGGRFVASLIILLFLVHPNIVQNMFDNFNCTDIDGEERVATDL